MRRRLALAGLAIAAAVAGFAVSAAEPAARSVSTGVVYYGMCPGGHVGAKVYEVDPNGGAAVAVGDGFWPRVSPTTDRIAMLRATANPSPPLVTWSLVIKGPDGSDVRSWDGPFGNSGDDRWTASKVLAWSPDGTQVVVNASDASGQPGYELRIYDDRPGGGYTSIPTAAPVVSLDWSGNTWAVVYLKTVGDATLRVAATVAARTGTGFGDLFTPTYDPGLKSYDRYASDVRVRGDGTIAWSGTHLKSISSADLGIFVNSGTFWLNAGSDVGGFAFSPDQSEVAMIRWAGFAYSSEVDVISWAGPYERTLARVDDTLHNPSPCGVDWGQTPGSPLASFTFRGTGPNTFAFDASASRAAPGDTISKYDWQFPEGTATGAKVTHTFATDGPQEVTLTVTDSQGRKASATNTLYAKLTISQVIFSPAAPVIGSPVTFKVTVRDDGNVATTGVTPAMTLAPDTVVTPKSGPTPASADLEPGTAAVFTFTANALAEGDATAEVDASGTGAIGAVRVTRKFHVGTTLLPLVVTATPPAIGLGGTAKVEVKATNKTGHAITNLVPKLTAAPANGVTLTGPTGGSATLAAGASTTFEWKLTAAKAAALALNASASATVPFDGSTVKSAAQGKLDVGAATITVNSTGDQGEAADSIGERICDFDPKKAGDQCTLRAAIELANAWTEASKVSIVFDIPAGGLPMIAPAKALDPITKTVSIDGSTQPGGWVQLSGKAVGAVDGLVLKGADSTLNALVVNGFADPDVVNGRAVVLAGARQRVTGSRVGTDPTGASGRGNGVGIAVEGTGDVVGSATGPGGNVVSANGVDVDVTAQATGAQVVGNLLGTTAGGVKALGRPSGTVVRAAGASTSIGGPTSSAGQAPGNVIGGETWAVEVTNPTVKVQGNLIGIGSDGVTPLNAADQVSGVHFSSSAGGFVLGGEAAGEGNVLGGFGSIEFGGENGAGAVSADAAGTIAGNFVGTDRSGQQAVENKRGIWVRADNVKVVGNLISGNLQGVVNFLEGGGAAAGTLVAGNVVGLSVDRSKALPNRTGIDIVGDGVVGGPRTSTGCSYPCNNIGGNWIGVKARDGASVLGNWFHDNKYGIEYLGSGTLGGSSRAASGTCDAACNLMTANAVGIVLGQLEDELGYGTGRLNWIRALGLGLPGNATVRGNSLIGNGTGILGGGDGHDVVIGGVGSGDGNLISGSSLNGILLAGGARAPDGPIDSYPQRISIRRNVIAASGLLGIGYYPTDFRSSLDHTQPIGVNGSRQGDDTATNGLPNEPELTTAKRSNGQIRVTGDMTRWAGDLSTYTLDVYADASCDPSGFGEGEILLGTTKVAFPKTTFTASFGDAAGAGFVSATATTGSGATSDFARCVPITGP